MKNILYILLVCLLSSCGLFRKVHKESTLDKITTSSIAKSDSSSISIDKSVTTIKERADTSVTIPAKTVTQETYFNMDSLINGMTAVKNELVDISFTLNPITHKLTTTAIIKPQSVALSIDKTTIKANDITSQIKRVQEKQDDMETEHKANLVDKKPAGLFWYAIIAIVVVGIIVFALYKRSGGK